jgi:hypothetical protein
VELIVSDKLRTRFDECGISGLTYERCFLSTNKREESSPRPIAWLARVAEGGAWRAEQARLPVCPHHQTVLPGKGGWITGRHFSEEELAPIDFQFLLMLEVSGRTYYSEPPIWFVSRRALAVILDERIRGMRTVTTFLKEKFKPVLFAGTPDAWT